MLIRRTSRSIRGLSFAVGVLLLLASGAVIVGGLGRGMPRAAGEELTVVTFGGRLRSAQMEVLSPVLAEQLTGRIVWAESLGELAPVGAQALAGNPVWDVVAMPIANSVVACERGWLEPISDADLGGVSSAEFEEGTRSECGIGSHIWAMVLSYRCDADHAPTELGDFFDLKRFPGRRALPRFPMGVFELALLADGVPREQVYAELRTEQGVQRALRKLETIRKELIWWDSGAQAAQLLVAGEVRFSMAPSARIALAAEGERLPLCILWRGAVRNVDAWSVLRGSKNRESAVAFIRSAIDPKVQAEMALLYPLSPVRRSSGDIIDAAPESDPDYRKWLATIRENSQDELTSDAEFWADQSEALQLRLLEWMSRR